MLRGIFRSLAHFLRRIKGDREEIQDPIDQYLSIHYPDNNWRSLSKRARKVWVNFHPIFNIYEIHTIAYIGAHIGTTVLALDEAYPAREFYLFEPLPQVFGELLNNTADRPNMHCLNVALGAQEGWADMFVDSYSQASSLLPYEPIAIQELPFLGRQMKREKVYVRPLDDVLQEGGIDSIDMLIIDVQGYEDRVLQGAKHTLKSCKVVVSELNLQPLYKESATFDSVYQILIREGFILRYLINPMIGKKSLQTLQIDGVFVRE